MRLFQSLGIFNKNIHTVSAFHVYLEKLYEIEKNKDDITSENFVVDNSVESNVAVSLENISFKYLGTEEGMFNELSLTIPRNQHTIITGPNGSGKSTLMGLMSGIFYPTSGKVRTFTNKYGYVSATPMILNSTLRENILYGNSNNYDDQLMIDFVTKFKVFNEDHKIDLEQKISNKTLSTGQMQKVSFIRSLISGIEILILDESTSNLDLESKKLIFEILNNQKITIINSTHSPEDFLGYDNHIVISIENNLRKVEFK